MFARLLNSFDPESNMIYPVRIPENTRDMHVVVIVENSAVCMLRVHTDSDLAIPELKLFCQDDSVRTPSKLAATYPFRNLQTRSRNCTLKPFDVKTSTEQENFGLPARLKPLRARFSFLVPALSRRITFVFHLSRGVRHCSAGPMVFASNA